MATDARTLKITSHATWHPLYRPEGLPPAVLKKWQARHLKIWQPRFVRIGGVYHMTNDLVSIERYEPLHDMGWDLILAKTPKSGVLVRIGTDGKHCMLGDYQVVAAPRRR
ncbi:MAG: hypothetical protein ACHREM_00410 [Polyangiales bacterium]